jgi:hypothetical protein
MKSVVSGLMLAVVVAAGVYGGFWAFTKYPPKTAA